MIKFFRNIRKTLIEESKTSKYIKYAIGEIILVVIGILIALQINNWNSFQNDRELEKQYLENFLIEMRIDSSFLNGYSNKTLPNKIKSLQLAREYAKYPIELTDTLTFLNQIGYGGILSRTNLFENRSTYNDMISTGNLRLIRDETSRNKILFYYTYVLNTVSYLDNLRTEYATFVNSKMPYDPKGNFKPDTKDFKRALMDFKSDTFLDLANNELTYAYSIKSRFDRMNTHLMDAMNLITLQLKTYKND